MEQVIRTLRGAGLRMTPLKLEVVEAFMDGMCCVSVSELRASLRTSASISSLYRCLRSLERAGFICRSGSDDGLYRYRRTDDFAPHHDHFRCSFCGRSIKVRDPGTTELMTDLEKRFGFRITGFEIEMGGTCPDCLENGHGHRSGHPEADGPSGREEPA